MSEKKQISKDVLENISKLAMLDLSEAEKEKFKDQLNDILNYFYKLNELDVDDIQPLIHPIEDLKNIFREDTPWKSLSNKEALKNAEHTKEGFFKAPRILKD